MSDRVNAAEYKRRAEAVREEIGQTEVGGDLGGATLRLADLVVDLVRICAGQQKAINDLRDTIRTDARAEVATAIESLHYDAPAAKTAQATAARIARGGVQ